LTRPPLELVLLELVELDDVVLLELVVELELVDGAPPVPELDDVALLELIVLPELLDAAPPIPEIVLEPELSEVCPPVPELDDVVPLALVPELHAALTGALLRHETNRQVDLFILKLQLLRSLPLRAMEWKRRWLAMCRHHASGAVVDELPRRGTRSRRAMRARRRRPRSGQLATTRSFWSHDRRPFPQIMGEQRERRYGARDVGARRRHR
jgi:hypothetical protein